MLEIYKENIRDLLGERMNSVYGTDLRIKENPKKGIYVEGLTEVYIVDSEELLSVLAAGN
jgi:hypothetical protein